MASPHKLKAFLASAHSSGLWQEDETRDFPILLIEKDYIILCYIILYYIIFYYIILYYIILYYIILYYIILYYIILYYIIYSN